jgi:hypothetical protein
VKVKLHRKSSEFQIPRLTKQQALADVAAIYKLLPKGKNAKPLLESFAHYPEFASDLDYGSYVDPLLVAKDRLSADFLKKFTGFAGEDPQKAAEETFAIAESWCKATNQRLRKLRNGARAPYLNSIILSSQRKISRLLGPKFSVAELLDEAKWGPGVTSSVKGTFVDAANKFQGKPEVSPNFARRAAQLMSCLPSWSALLADCDSGTWVTPVLSVIRGNRVAFVPKTAKTHRSIAVEPHVNSFFQLGAGRMIRKRLLRGANINLNSQELNQRLAKLGSVDGSLATIDLTSASDTVSKELVRELLPEDWFSWLDELRSKEGQLPNGEWLLYEKFSSMGNGFTFDLESIIFWAVSTSVVDSLGYNPFWVNVMGDDIIVPTRCYSRVVRVLALLGFVVNKKKSFASGPFRESCGKDYFRGYNVRPLYLKDIPDTPMHWLRIANGIRRLSVTWLENYGTNKSLKPAYDFAVSRIPLDFRKKIPDGFGDGGLIVNFDEASPPLARDNPRTAGWEGYSFQHIAAKAVSRKFSSRSLITSSIHRSSQRGNDIALRDQVVYKKATSIAASWQHLGDWV